MNKYLNRTDFVLIGACVLTLIIFTVNMKLASVIPLYVNSIILLGTFAYWGIRKDNTGILKPSLIISAIGGALYILGDSRFVEMKLIIYRVEDIKILATPASIVLTWIYGITIGIYLYQRLYAVFGRFYIPSLLTGMGAFISGVVFNYLGARAWLWIWDNGVPPSPNIGSIPLFVPVALFVTFLLSPYIIGGQRISRWINFSQNPLVSGLRCAILLMAAIFFSFRIFIR